MQAQHCSYVLVLRGFPLLVFWFFSVKLRKKRSNGFLNLEHQQFIVVRFHLQVPSSFEVLIKKTENILSSNSYRRRKSIYSCSFDPERHTSKLGGVTVPAMLGWCAGSKRVKPSQRMCNEKPQEWSSNDAVLSLSSEFVFRLVVQTGANIVWLFFNFVIIKQSVLCTIILYLSYFTAAFMKNLTLTSNLITTVYSYLISNGVREVGCSSNIVPRCVGAAGRQGDVYFGCLHVCTILVLV